MNFQEAIALSYRAQADSRRFVDGNVAEATAVAAKLFSLRCSRRVLQTKVVQDCEESLIRREDGLRISLLLRAQVIRAWEQLKLDSPNQLRLPL